MRTRIVLRHDPIFAVGLISHRRNNRPLRALARAIAFRFLEARAHRKPRIGGCLPARGRCAA
jgi:hypothetical protein